MARGLVAAQRVCGNDPRAWAHRYAVHASKSNQRKPPRALLPPLTSRSLRPAAGGGRQAGWAGNHVIARAAGGHVPPASLAVVRWIVVALLVAPFALVHARRDWPKLKANRRLILLFSITGGGLFGTLQFVALHFTTALNMGLVGSVAPAFIVAASWIPFRDRLNALQMFGVLVSLSGVLAIGPARPRPADELQLQRRRPHHHRQHDAVGDLLGLPAAAARHPPHDLHAGDGGGRGPRQRAVRAGETRSTTACRRRR